MKIELIILLTICLICTNSFPPTKPLNERSTELAWQAWLLVDDQNQNNKNDGSNNSLLRRRITPKSVFIAPTFSPELLPACADGYKSDSMGRCIKIIKLDESAHLEFLLAKLNEQFGDYDDGDEESDDEHLVSSASSQGGSTQGPLQFNIPLNGGDGDDNFHLTPISFDGDQKKTSTNDENETDVAIVVAPTNGDFFRIKQTNDNNETKLDVKRDEDLIETTTSPSTISTTSEEVSETSFMTETLSPSTTTIINGEGEAIFFLNPTTTETQTDINDGDVTSTVASSTNPTITTTTTSEDITTITTTTIGDQSQRITFPTTNPIIRFPDDDTVKSYLKFPETVNKHQTRDTLKQFKLSSTTTTTEQSIIVNDNIEHKLINHRNRDKHNKLFLLPTKWSDSSPNNNKPFILRLSRKHGYNMNTEQFNNQPNYYRELQGDNLSFLFGFKQNNHHR